MSKSPHNPQLDLEPGNHPLASRMAAIAFLAYNLVMGCIFGSYGVLMQPIEAKLGLTRDVSSLGIPLQLLGLHGSAVVAVVSLALSQRFGQANYGRLFGLSNLVNLPLMVLGVPIAGHLYVRTGSYMSAMLGLIALFVVGAIAAAVGGRGKALSATTPLTPA